MKKRVILFVFCFLLLFPVVAWGKIIGQEGNVYKITERNIKELMAEKAATFDVDTWQKDAQAHIKNRVREFRPADASYGLPAAAVSSSYRVDVSYTLPYDLYDAQGNLIYPQGFTFNPLEQMEKVGMGLSRPYIIINAERPEELLWLDKKLQGNLRDIASVLITDGYAYEVSKILNRPVRYLSEIVKSRLAVKTTPTLVMHLKGDKHLFATQYLLDKEGEEIWPEKDSKRTRRQGRK